MAAGLTGLGLDAGGSATRWALWGADGLIRAGALMPVDGHLYAEADRARFARMAADLRAAIGEAAPIGRIVAGITGLSGASPEAPIAAAMLAEALGVKADAIRIEGDIWLAYHAAFAPGEGIVVYCGTGSIAIHIIAGGDEIRAGGRGMLIDDAGSAFWIGREALNLILRAEDANPEARSTLADAVFAAIGGGEWDRIRSYVYGGGRDAVAQLARAVASAATEGDTTALSLLHQAGAELARLATALAARIGPRPVALLGRAAGLHPAILDAMREAAAPLAVERHPLDGAATAARLAYQAIAP